MADKEPTLEQLLAEYPSLKQQLSEHEFDFSVLWREEEPSPFTLPQIIMLVMLFLILVLGFFGK